MTWANGTAAVTSVTAGAGITVTGTQAVTIAANALPWTNNRVETDETIASAVFGNLATVGPAVTVTVGASGMVVLIISGNLYNVTAGGYCIMGWAATGANTIAAATAKALTLGLQAATLGPQAVSSLALLLTGLTAGSTTFTAKYQNGGTGTAHFANRELSALAL